MTRYRHSYQNHPHQNHYVETPRRRGMIMGVCADFANAFAFDVTLVRLATLLLLCFFTGTTLLAYIVLGFLGGRR
jgi:phage shock protein PspC (stress-responsive transcriptional regulator)